MEAYKFHVTVSEQRRLILDVPADAPAGDAEVILLFSRIPISPAQDSLGRFLEDLQQTSGRGQEEIDRQLQDERNQWD